MNTIPEALSAGRTSKYNPVPDSLPDIITAAQYAAMNTPTEPCGERRLKFAVLADAIAVAQGGGVKERGWRLALKEAVEWLASDASGCGFSFTDICAELGWPSVNVRAWIAEGKGLMPIPGRHNGIGKIRIQLEA